VTRITQFTALALAISLLIPSLAQAGGVYKWVDEQGVVHYSDRPGTRTDAEEVAGVNARASEQERLAAEAVTLGGDQISAQMLQGLWCEHEMAIVGGASEPEERRIEWDFYEGDELQHRDLRSGRRVETTFSVERNQIRAESASLGTHRILRFNGESMELGVGEQIHRLRKGGC